LHALLHRYISAQENYLGAVDQWSWSARNPDRPHPVSCTL